jgi:polysaccharide biosynthesis/export protein
MFLERRKTRIRSKRLLMVLTFGIAALAGAQGSAHQTEKAPESEKTPAATPEPAPALAYTIAPADVLQVNVWKEPDLTREFEVRLDGMITVPLVGDVPAAGLAPSQLAENLTKAIQKFIDAPRVTVGVRANSARFYVLGQVTKSGEFALTGRTTVVQGLALAGGFREFAKTESIAIIRQDQTVIQVNYKRIADGKEVSQNVVLAPGDTVVVP